MRVEILQPLGDNYVYLMHDNGIGAAVDPGDAQCVLAALQKLEVKLSHVLVTHHHFDHTGGCAQLKSATGCTVVGPDDSRVPSLDQPVGEGDVVTVGRMEFNVLSVPGHTRSHVIYHLPTHNMLFTGDALFVCGCGRLLEETATEMWDSMKRIRNLPEDTKVYCGHDYTLEDLEFALDLEPANPMLRDQLAATQKMLGSGLPTVPSTIEQERITNPFLRCDTEALHKALGIALPSEPDSLDASAVQLFAEIRRRKDSW